MKQRLPHCPTSLLALWLPSLFHLAAHLACPRLLLLLVTIAAVLTRGRTRLDCRVVRVYLELYDSEPSVAAALSAALSLALLNGTAWTERELQRPSVKFRPTALLAF